MTDEDGSKFDLDYAVVIGKVSNERTKRIAGISVGAIVAAGVTGCEFSLPLKLAMGVRRDLID
jgi:hypothetical protein